MLCSGSFVQDCFGVGPDLVEQCSSAATRQWTPCVPAATPVRLPVMALLGNGAAADGLQGSLCTLAGAAFQQGCTRPFACVPIPALYLGPNILQVRSKPGYGQKGLGDRHARHLEVAAG